MRTPELIARAVFVGGLLSGCRLPNLNSAPPPPTLEASVSCKRFDQPTLAVHLQAPGSTDAEKIVIKVSSGQAEDPDRLTSEQEVSNNNPATDTTVHFSRLNRYSRGQVEESVRIQPGDSIRVKAFEKSVLSQGGGVLVVARPLTPEVTLVITCPPNRLDLVR